MKKLVSDMDMDWEIHLKEDIPNVKEETVDQREIDQETYVAKDIKVKEEVGDQHEVNILHKFKVKEENVQDFNDDIEIKEEDFYDSESGPNLEIDPLSPTKNDRVLVENKAEREEEVSNNTEEPPPPVNNDDNTNSDDNAFMTRNPNKPSKLFRNKLKLLHDSISELADQYADEQTLGALESLINRVRNVRSSNQLNSLLESMEAALPCVGRRKIPCQPTSIARVQQGMPRGAKGRKRKVNLSGKTLTLGPQGIFIAYCSKMRGSAADKQSATEEFFFEAL